MTLLQYIVSTYVSKFERDLAGTDRAKLPVPEYSDVTQAMLVQFDDIEKELKKIQKDFDGTKTLFQEINFQLSVFVLLHLNVLKRLVWLSAHTFFY